MIDEHKKNENTEENLICDITSANEYIKLKKEIILGDYDVCLLWNIDDASISNSSNGQIWPLQVQVVNIPAKNRRNFQFLAGIYYSTVQKPNINSFLKPFSIIMKDLSTNGVK